MSFGLRIRGADGVVRIDTGDKVGRLVHRSVLPANTSGTVSVPGFDATNSFVLTQRLGGVGASFIDEYVGAHLAGFTSPGVVTFTKSTNIASLYTVSLLLVIAFGDQ